MKASQITRPSHFTSNLLTCNSIMFRRNSLSFSWKLVSPPTSPNNPSLHLLRTSSSIINYGRSNSAATSPSSSSTPAVADSVKMGFGIPDGVRAFGSAATIETSSSFGAVSVSKAIDVARYYGQCYWELSKARLSMLVVATSGAGYVLGSGSTIDFLGLSYTCAGTMMVAAAANSLNQVFEITNDAKMKRTMRRPLPSGRITVPHAVTWASSVGLAGTALLAWKTNMLAAGLGASNLVLYAFVYTPLKQIHPVNTWVGAVVGAIPPLLGWAAASGQVSLNGMILPAALYFWQIPHFMALAYLCREDYAAGGFRMFSLADASGRRTALVALRNCLYLLPLGYLAYDWGITSGWFCLESTLLALAITGTSLSFYQNRTKKTARRMFHASLLYLPVFMSGIMFHRLSDNQQGLEVENSQKVVGLSSSPEASVKEAEHSDQQNKRQKHISSGGQKRPPVALASVAPFPFLPAPSYDSSY